MLGISWESSSRESLHLRAQRECLYAVW